jgi:hypothetical protein
MMGVKRPVQYEIEFPFYSNYKLSIIIFLDVRSLNMSLIGAYLSSMVLLSDYGFLRNINMALGTVIIMDIRIKKPL